MQRFLGTIDFGSIFAYPKPAQPVPPSLAEKYGNEARDKAQREHCEREEQARRAAMTQAERRAWIEEQRRKFEEQQALCAMTPSERRDFVERVQRENAPLQYRETNTSVDSDNAVVFTQPVFTERTTRSEERTTHTDAGERRDYESSYASYSQPLLTAPNGHGDVVGVPVVGADGADLRVRYATEYGDDETHEEALWNRWLARNLKYERTLNYKVVGAEMREQDEKIRALERRVEQLQGQLDLVSKHFRKGRRR